MGALAAAHGCPSAKASLRVAIKRIANQARISSLRSATVSRRARSPRCRYWEALPGAGIGHRRPRFLRRLCVPLLEQLDGDAVRRADECHAAVAGRAIDGDALL